MSELNIPESWAYPTLGQIGSTMIGLTYSPSDISNTGVPVLRSGNIQNGKIDFNDLVRVKKEIRPQLMIKDGDILICARNGSKALVGKAAQIKSKIEPMTFGAFMAIYRSEFNGYIEFFLQSSFFREQLEGVGTATINQITQNNLKQFKIPLPPFNEQKRIVQKITSCFERIEAVEKNLNRISTLSGRIADANGLIQSLKESIFKKAFEGQLVEQVPSEGTGHELLARILTEKESSDKLEEETRNLKKSKVSVKVKKSKGNKNGKK